MDLLKVKLFNDEEFTIFDIEISEKPMLNKDGKTEMTKCVGSLLFKLDNGNICKVGSGITDQQRIDWYIDPNKIIGKTVTIKYKEKTKNADGTYSLQFPVLTTIYDNIRDI